MKKHNEVMGELRNLLMAMPEYARLPYLLQNIDTRTAEQILFQLKGTMS